MSMVFDKAKRILSPKIPNRIEDFLNSAFVRGKLWRTEPDEQVRPTPIDPSRTPVQGTDRVDVDVYDDEMSRRHRMIRGCKREHELFSGTSCSPRDYIEGYRENELMLSPAAGGVAPMRRLPVLGKGGAVVDSGMEQAVNDNILKQVRCLTGAMDEAARSRANAGTDIYADYSKLHDRVFAQAVEAEVKGFVRISPEVKAEFGGEERFDAIAAGVRKSMTEDFGVSARSQSSMTFQAFVEAAAGEYGKNVAAGQAPSGPSGGSGRRGGPSGRSYHDSHAPDTSDIEREGMDGEGFDFDV